MILLTSVIVFGLTLKLLIVTSQYKWEKMIND